ncbi:MAG: 50S ribosomal protein L1 [Nitrosopumilales archaeon]|nr:MAG: 50S ribosomal protein L1 [Nitrosopumilales archaeon]
MVNEGQLVEMIKQAKSSKERKFKQALELIMVFKDIDVKKGFTINETVQLPKQAGSPASVCVMASGDMGLKAKNAKADKVLDTDELNKLGSDKRESRKFINKYDFFLADTKLMPVVGKVLGQLLGPRGKMPTPVPFNAPIESLLERFRSSIRVRVRNSLSMACKIGDEKMEDGDLVANASAVISAVEKKLPNGDKNIKKILVKTTMGKAVKESTQVKKKNA